jgi:hypothetical protein
VGKFSKQVWGESPERRQLLTLVFYGLRDGEIRALAAGAA